MVAKAKAKLKKAKATKKHAAKKSAKSKIKKSKKTTSKAKKASKKAAKKSAKTLKKATKSHKKAVKAATKAQLHKNCRCNGTKDKKGHGGSCKNWGWRMPWCYVSNKCEDVGAKVRGGKKWVPGC